MTGGPLNLIDRDIAEQLFKVTGVSMFSLGKDEGSAFRAMTPVPDSGISSSYSWLVMKIDVFDP